jgi:outer membrane protein assembly factor BamA
VPDGQARDSSTIAITTLLGGLDQPIGRQRLYGSATLRHLSYSGASALNNQAYDLNLGLDWSTVERVSGRVQAQASRRLDQATILDRNSLTLVGAKNQQKTEGLNATVRVGTVTPLTLEGSLAWRRQDMSLTELSNQDYDSTAVSLGLRYRFSGALSAGAALRHTENDYPRWSATEGNRIKRDDLDLNATWVASGASTLNARLSLGESRHSASSQQGFSGATGALAWDWRPTGKLKLDTTLQRDTGVESDVAYRSGPASVVLADDSRLTA